VSLEVRPARPEDRPHLVRFMAGLQETERALHPSRRPGAEAAADHFAFLEDHVSGHDGLILCAAPPDGPPVGFLLGYVEDFGGHYLHPDQRRVGWIADLWIDPEHRGGDLLDRLLAAAERHFAALGLTRLMLAFVTGNIRAETAYRKRGFTDYETILEREIG
jgi:GNAT superfamily N-acetyltransferase